MSESNTTTGESTTTTSPATEIPVAPEMGAPPTNNNNNNNDQKEVKNNMNTIHHFIKGGHVSGKTVTWRRFGTKFSSPEEAQDYEASVRSGHPENYLLALNTGTWKFNLLEQVGHDKAWNVTVFSRDDMAKIGPDTIRQWVQDSTFSWANDSHSYFLRVDGYDTLEDAFGIHVKDAKKIAKRLAEVVRLSELSWFSPHGRVNIQRSKSRFLKLEDSKGEMIAVDGDGLNAVSRDFMKKCVSAISDPRIRRRRRKQIMDCEINMAQGWILTPDGLIKGRFIVSDNLPEGVDVVYHKENLKPELYTDGYIHASFIAHEPWHMAVYDNQTTITARKFLSDAKHRADANFIFDSINNSFQEGVVPDWFLLGDDMHDDEGLPDLEKLSEILDRQYIQAQLAGLDIRVFQNAVYLATNGELLRMTSDYDKHRDLFRRTWVPMTNAFSAAVVTNEALFKLAKVNLPKVKHLQYHAHYGLVMTAQRFLDTFVLHGTWDGDDTVKVILQKYWSSDPNKVDILRDSGALDPAIGDIPANPEDAVHAALLLRSPNGPGEYSIEALPENWMDFPWFQPNFDAVETIDLALVPDPQNVQMANVVTLGIPESLTYSGKTLDKDKQTLMILAQQSNPLVGKVCSWLMHWSMSFGASYPDHMLDDLGAQVDAVMQTYDPVSFEAIAENVDQSVATWCEKLEEAGVGNAFVDAKLLQTYPVGREYAKRVAPFMVNGRYSRFNMFYGTLVTKLRDRILKNSLQMRHNVELVRQVRQLQVTPATQAWAKSFYDRYNHEFRIAQETWQHPSEDDNKFTKMHFQQKRIEANREVVLKAVAELEAFGGDDVHKRVLSLWWYILTPKPGLPYGLYDRIMFAPGEEDRSVMHLLINALRWIGLL